MAEYVSVSANKEHIDRHFTGSLVPGSKFLPMSEDDKQAVIDLVDLRLAEFFQKFLDEGREPSRVIFQINFPKAVGTDALVAIPADRKDSFITVTRDAGTPYESRVQVHETNEIPETSTVTVIAGPYGPTGKWGIYTMFPGAEALAFPNPERQAPDALKASKTFWDTHGFLATRAEIQACLPPSQNSAQTPSPNPQ